MTAVFTAAAAENTDQIAVTNTTVTWIKFSSHSSKMSFTVEELVKFVKYVYSLAPITQKQVILDVKYSF